MPCEKYRNESRASDPSLTLVPRNMNFHKHHHAGFFSRQVENPLNEDLPVYRSKDGQELQFNAGRKVSRLIYVSRAESTFERCTLAVLALYSPCVLPASYRRPSKIRS